MSGVCSWYYSPSEVSEEEFIAWTIENMPKVDAKNVQWSNVFCELFVY